MREIISFIFLVGSEAISLYDYRVVSVDKICDNENEFRFEIEEG
jgi:hypothetical protein